MSQTKPGYKEYKCKNCGGEFVRRAVKIPELCFRCEWLLSEKKKQQDLDAFDPSI